MAFWSLRLALCGHRKFLRASRNLSTWRQEAFILRLRTFMLGPKTVTLLMGHLVPRTTHPTMHLLHTRRVMWHRGRYTEHRPSMKDIAQRTRRAEPTLTRQSTLMRKNLRRGRLRPCHTTTLRIVYSTKSMVGRHTVTEICTMRGGSARTVLCLDWDDAFSSLVQAQLLPAPISQVRWHALAADSGFVITK